MEQVLVTSLVAALVAAVVTLGIEYMAKPRLESRKERLLERDRDTRLALTHFNELSFSLGRLLGMIETPEYRFADRFESTRAEMDASLRGFRGCLARSDLRLRPYVEHGLVEFASSCEAYLYMSRNGLSEAEGDKMLTEHMSPLADAVDDLTSIRPWRRGRRAQLRHSIQVLSSPHQPD